MRKTVCLINALLLLLLLAIPARAEEPLLITDLGIAFSVPDGLEYITQDTPVDDPYFGSPEVGEEYISHMKEEGIHFSSPAPDGSWEITVISLSMALFKDMQPDESTMKLLEQFITLAMEQAGAEISALEIYHGPLFPFVHTTWYHQETDRYSDQYNTVLNGKVTGFCVYGYGTPIFPEQQGILLSMVDSVQLTEVTAVPDSTESRVEAPSFSYCEKESGAVLTVPDGWIEIPLSKEREYVDAKFQWVEDPSVTMIFGAIDLWSEMGPLEQMFLSRDALNIGAFADEDLADAFGVDVSAIERILLDGRVWARIISPMTATALGEEISIESTVLVAYDNGWQYSLQTTGKPGGTIYEDMEEMAKSIQIPPSDESPGNEVLIDEVPADEAPAAGSSDNSSLAILAYVLLAGAALSVTLALLLKRHQMKQIKRCPRCGYICKANDSFCSNCGIRLP